MWCVMQHTDAASERVVHECGVCGSCGTLAVCESGGELLLGERAWDGLRHAPTGCGVLPAKLSAQQLAAAPNAPP